MVKFFQRIRRKLIDEGHLKKYMIYAVGEILLVVIGILIALQLNSWNQNRLDDIEEKRILTSISQELKLSTFLYKRGKEIQNNKIAAATTLLKRMGDNKDGYDPEYLDVQIQALILRWMSGTPTSIYDALIGSGELKLISNEELRNELAQFKSDQEFLRLFEEIQVRFIDQEFSPYINQYINRGNIRSKESNNPAILDMPKLTFETSYDLLLKSKQFANLLVECIEHTHRVVANYERLDRSVNKIDSLARLNQINL